MSLRRRSRALALQLLYQRSLMQSLLEPAKASLDRRPTKSLERSPENRPESSIGRPTPNPTVANSSASLLSLEREPKTLLRDFIVDFEVDPAVADYGGRVFLGVCENQIEIDKLIEAQSRHWKVARMSLVDLSLLRIACFELKFSDGSVPSSTVLDEAIELAREFGSTDSASFVNGILDPIARSL